MERSARILAIAVLALALAVGALAFEVATKPVPLSAPATCVVGGTNGLPAVTVTGRDCP